MRHESHQSAAGQSNPGNQHDGQRRRQSGLDRSVANEFDLDMPFIVQIHEWPAAAIEGLLAESEQEGFRFVRRAKEEWLSGMNTFSKEGEALFAVFEKERILAMGGINRG